MNEDLSNIFEKFNINKDSISPEMVESLMGMINNNPSQSENSSHEENHARNNFTADNLNSIDIDTFIKLKSVMDKMNTKDNPRSKLLQSLKPYLKENRKNKIDQYIQFSKIMEVLPYLGGDNKHGQ